MSETSWKEIWERKGQSARQADNYSVADLFTADGFDGALGKISDEAQKYMGDFVRQHLAIAKGASVLEVGCGAGAVLSLLAEEGISLAGVDYSAPHIDIARKALPGARLAVGEAIKLPFGDAGFDGVFSNGVFLYFSDLQYATQALKEMLRVVKPNAPLLILDLPDAATKEQCIAARTAAGASLNPPHLYYPRVFFSGFAATQGRRATFFPQSVPGYGNSAFRYNVLIST